MVNVVWTTEQVLSLAPDKYSIKTAHSLAFVEKWSAFGRMDGLVWGEFPVPDRPAFQVCVTLPQIEVACRCKSRKYPCDHGLALLLLLVQQPGLFEQGPPPAGRDDAAALDSPSNNVNPSSQAAKADRRRQATVLVGLQELELWLRDLVRHGLAVAKDKPKTYWNHMADRLVDAQLGMLAGDLRELSALPAGEPDWPEQMLAKIGRLHLFIQAFKQFDRLPVIAQADLQAAIGWWPREATLADQPPLRDIWHVLGHQIEPEGRRRLQRVWLWGEQSNRPAQLLELLHSRQQPNLSLPVGAAVEADLRFYPGAAPLLGQLIVRHGTFQPRHAVAGYVSIKAALAAWAQALAANPWLRCWPMVVPIVAAADVYGRWQVSDRAGQLLPLPEKSSFGWHLSAASRGGEVPLFGEWTGDIFQPYSFWQHDRWLPLHILEGVR